jgi:hypothetical protein
MRLHSDGGKEQAVTPELVLWMAHFAGYTRDGGVLAGSLTHRECTRHGVCW